jgi:hypothetical protein
MDFAKLKSMSGKKGLEALTAEITKIASSENSKKGPDERFWTPTVDKAGNGYAVIRFLPAPEGEDVPFVRLWDHGFQGPTGLWYIENSLSSVGNPDPVMEYNSKLWNANNSDDSLERKQARKQKRRLHYIVNIYVEQDSANPENEGKVKLFKFGKKIFDKIQESMVPQFADEEPMNPFDPWSGAKFKLKIRNVEGYRNYDKSEFDKPSALADSDDRIQEIWSQCASLQDFLDPKHFKTYEELKSRLMKVLDESGPSVIRAEKLSEAPMPVTKSKAAPKIEESPFVEEGEDDDSLEFFKKLAKN